MEEADWPNHDILANRHAVHSYRFILRDFKNPTLFAINLGVCIVDTFRATPYKTRLRLWEVSLGRFRGRSEMCSGSVDASVNCHQIYQPYQNIPKLQPVRCSLLKIAVSSSAINS